MQLLFFEIFLSMYIYIFTIYNIYKRFYNIYYYVEVLFNMFFVRYCLTLMRNFVAL